MTYLQLNDITRRETDPAIIANLLRKGWQEVAAPPPPPPPPPMWMNAQAFMAAFTMEEKAAVALSSDPIIAALRLELSTWLSPVHVDDERVQLGLNRLVELEILTNDRKNAIISVAS